MTAVQKKGAPFLVFGALVMFATLTMSNIALASLESSLVGLKTQLTGVILPLLSVIGMAFAAMSFYTGHPQAKQHVFYAILGSIFGFGAQAIIDFISQTVN